MAAQNVVRRRRETNKIQRSEVVAGRRSNGSTHARYSNGGVVASGYTVRTVSKIGKGGCFREAQTLSVYNRRKFRSWIFRFGVSIVLFFE